jgi:hypothetical protein
MNYFNVNISATLWRKSWEILWPGLEPMQVTILPGLSINEGYLFFAILSLACRSGDSMAERRAFEYFLCTVAYRPVAKR